MYVANQYSNSVSVINTTTNTVTATIPVGAGPYGLGTTPDGSMLYVTNNGGNADSVSVINTATNTVVATVIVRSNPYNANVSADGSKVYVTNEFGNAVSVISTATNTVINTIFVGSNPSALGNFISTFGTGIVSMNNESASVNVYPNPNNGTFMLSYSLPQSGTSTYELGITDVLGSNVYSQPITNPTQSAIDISQLSNGVYFYQLTNNKEAVRGKFVKE